MNAIDVLSEQAEHTEKTLDLNLRSLRPDWTLRTHRFLGAIASVVFFAGTCGILSLALSGKVNVQ